MRVVIYAPSRSALARRDRELCGRWCGDQGWDVTQFAGSPADAAHAIRTGVAEVVVVAWHRHRKHVAALGLPVIQATPDRSRAPVAAVPLLWLGEQWREHPVWAAALAGVAAGALTWWLLPGPDREVLLLPPPSPPVVLSPSPVPVPSPGPDRSGPSRPPATGTEPLPGATAAPPDDRPVEPPPVSPPPPASPPPPEPTRSSTPPSNRPPEQLPTPVPDPACLRVDLLGIHLAVCLPLAVPV